MPSSTAPACDSVDGSIRAPGPPRVRASGDLGVRSRQPGPGDEEGAIRSDRRRLDSIRRRRPCADRRGDHDGTRRERFECAPRDAVQHAVGHDDDAVAVARRRHEVRAEGIGRGPNRASGAGSARSAAARTGASANRRRSTSADTSCTAPSRWTAGAPGGTTTTAHVVAHDHVAEQRVTPRRSSTTPRGRTRRVVAAIERAVPVEPAHLGLGGSNTPGHRPRRVVLRRRLADSAAAARSAARAAVSSGPAGAGRTPTLPARRSAHSSSRRGPRLAASRTPRSARPATVAPTPARSSSDPSARRSGVTAVESGGDGPRGAAARRPPRSRRSASACQTRTRVHGGPDTGTSGNAASGTGIAQSDGGPHCHRTGLDGIAVEPGGGERLRRRRGQRLRAPASRPSAIGSCAAQR